MTLFEQEKSAFEVFWNKYPRKDSKKNAERAFNNLSITKQNECIKGLDSYLMALKENPDRPKMLPTTWINQERWEDDFGLKQVEVKQEKIVGEIDWDNEIYNSNKQEINNLTNYIIKLLGLKEKQYPDEEQRDIIYFFLKKHFKLTKLESIRDAFEAWVCGEFEFKMFATDTFSARTMASILNIYRNKGRRVNTGILQSDIKEKIATIEEKEQIHQEFLLECFINPWSKLINEGEWVFNEFSLSYLYTQLLEMGIDVLDNTEKEHIKARCLSDRPEENKYKGSLAMLVAPVKNSFQNDYYSKLFKASIYKLREEKKDLITLLV